MSFTWIPIYEEIARKLLEFEDRQGELLALLGKLRAEGLKVIQLNDRDASGKVIPLAEIDPLTFFASFNRSSVPDRQAILQRLKTEWNLSAPVPQDFDGIPLANAQNSWAFAYAAEREPNDVPILWRVAREAVAKDWRTFDQNLFNEALGISQMGMARMSMSLFWMKPRAYLSLDKNTRAYFERHGINCESKTAAGYHSWMEKVVAKIGDNFPQISLDAYQENGGSESGPTGADDDDQSLVLQETATADSKRRYWLYSPGEQARFWQECQDKEIIVIGYDDLEDFHQYKSQEDVEKNLKELWGKAERPYNHSRAVWEFANVIQPGDVVIVKKGRSEYLGYGVVNGPCARDDSRPEFKSFRKVSWKKIGNWSADFDLAIKTLTDITKYPDYVKQLVKLIGIDQNNITEVKPSPMKCLEATNTILYGPPGTGKTYKTIERAVQIIEPGFTGDHAAFKTRFDALRAKGQIEFITFHQSYSYEDFVEGLRPVIEGPESSEAAYEYSSGVFKRFAFRALFDCLKPVAGIVSFDAVWNKLVEQTELEPDKLYPGLSEKTSYRISLSTKGNLDGVNTISDKTFLCSRSILEKVFVAKPDYDKVSSGEVMEVVARGCHAHFVAAMFNELKRIEKNEFAGKGASPEAAVSSEQKEGVAQAFLEKTNPGADAYKPADQWPQYVLVIDEINRGNISKILGELITLIEPDKRLGAENSLVVTLPYTKHRFAVPGNLHLLGTMNTADKSIALVDVALRRRFQFEELRANFDYCHGLTQPMRDLLNALNRRICLRKDRDHQIGHSYFIKESDAAGFNRVFARHVVPLLQEYFYNDWDGLRFVLGVKNQPDKLIIPLKDGVSGDSRSSWQWSFEAGNNSVNDVDFLQLLGGNGPAT